jgi:hypothetical protein
MACEGNTTYCNEFERFIINNILNRNFSPYVSLEGISRNKFWESKNLRIITFCSHKVQRISTFSHELSTMT